MKLKGISKVEQHIEKIVLGVMVLVLLGVVSSQFLLEPNAIDVGGGKKVGPDKVLTELERDVNKLAAAVSDPTPTLPDIGVPNLIGEYERVFASDSLDVNSLPIALGRAARVGGEVNAGVVSTGPMMGVPVPTPSLAMAYGAWITADPYVLEEVPELAAFMPAEQPFDVVGATVEAVLDGATMLNQLRDGVDGRRPIPATWWRGGLSVLEVVAERQQQLPDGSWSAVEVVEKMPGTPELSDLLRGQGELTPLELREVVSSRGASLEEIARPPYLPQIAGVEWVEPSKAIERDSQFAEMSDVDVLQTKRRSLLSQIERAEQELNRQPDQRTREPGGGERDLVNPGGGGRTPGSGTNRPARDTAEQQRLAEERRRANITRRIDGLRKQVEDVEKQLTDLGVRVVPQGEAVAGGLGNQPTQPAPLVELLGTQAFKVWVHDLGVEPGGVYRYRVQVKVNNPLFGKETSLDPAAGDDVSLAREAFATSAWSEWTEPVSIGRETYLFVVSADEATTGQGAGVGSIGGGDARVTAEVYHMYYGYYRRGLATLKPGDTLSTDVRVPDGLLLFDTEVVSRADAHALLGIGGRDRFGVRPGLRPAGLPSERRDEEDPFMVPPDRMPTGDPQIPTEVRPDPRGGQPTAPATLPEVLPEGVTKAPTRIAVEIDAMLLDVVRLPIAVIEGVNAQARAAFAAYFQSEGGQIESRRPDVDRSGDAYGRVLASFRQATSTAEEE